MITHVTALDGTSLRLATQDFTTLSIEDFTGRAWLFDELAAFRSACEAGYLVVEAAAGLGKTSFATELAKHPHHVGHFTKLEGGASRRAALLNLSAQLITELDLFPEIERAFMLPDLDRTRVPEWAAEPEYFAKLLRLAAGKATADGHDLTLVVDGLDEEEPPSMPVPLGLPARPPPGVYIVALLRSGTPITLVDAESRVVRIAADDPRNLADMNAYLRHVAGMPYIGELLRRHEATSDEFAAMLIERCEGVWIHLRYLLADIRTGDVDLDRLDQLPDKLSYYFAHSLVRHRSVPTWADADLPVLGMVGAAAEPISAHMITDVTKVPAPHVRRLCDLRYRAFLRVDRTGGGRRFSPAHRSFGEFLSEPATGGLPDAVLDLRDELAERVAATHGELADHYLTAFRERPGDFARLHGGYGLRRCPAHLRAAGRRAELRALLMPASGWSAAQREHGDMNAYTEDLVAELDHAAGLVDATPTLRPDAEPLLFEIFGTLFLAGRTAVAGDVPVDLVSPLLQSAVWTLDEASAHLDSVSNPQLLSVGLFNLLPHLPRPAHDRCLARIRDTAAAISSPEDRVGVLTQLLTDDEDPSTVLAEVDSIRNATAGVQAVLAIAARVSSRRDALLEYALDKLADVPDPAARSAAFVQAAAVAPADLVGQLIADALSTADEADLARRDDDTILPGFHLDAGLVRTDVAAGLLRFAPEAVRRGLWEEVRTADVPDGVPGFTRLATLAEHAVDPVERNLLLKAAINRARAVPDIRVVAASMQEVSRILEKRA
ncbi:hypothetical protein ACWEF6_00540 [Amycolatopsis sp. NPDC004772]